MAQNIVIIGAGMAGVTCARLLADAGHAPIVLDKGRGIGGRMATRRAKVGASEVSFDHGAQYLSGGFATHCSVTTAHAEALSTWRITADEDRTVAVPGMSTLPCIMAQGVQVMQNAEVARIWREGVIWQVQTNDQVYAAANVVLTIPAPQIMPLFAQGNSDMSPFADTLATVRMAPCLTLMAAFPQHCPRPFTTRRSDTDPLAWIAQNSAKPGRADGVTTWIAQASAEWSAAHLEEDRETIAALMLPLLCDILEIEQDQVLYRSGHKWRYARVTAPVGKPFIGLPEEGLYLGGDWCLGPKVEDACSSGAAIARAILTARSKGDRHVG